MKITTDGREVLESKTFLAIGLGKTFITIGGDGQEKLNFILNFVENDSKKHAIAWEVVDRYTVMITLTNWNNTLGTTLLKPVEVGTYKHRRIFILFCVARAGGENSQIRLVTFSAYLGEEVHDGRN